MPEGAKKQHPAARWGGLLMVAAIIGGLVVGFNILTIGLFVAGLVALIVGLVLGKKSA